MNQVYPPLEKRPRSILLPIIVPRGAQIPEQSGDFAIEYVEVDWKWIGLVFLAAVGLGAMLPGTGRRSSAGSVHVAGVPKKTPTNRLFYMIEKPLPGKRVRGTTFVSIPRKDARMWMEELRKGKSSHNVYPVYAKSADEARAMIERGFINQEHYIPPWTPGPREGPEQMTFLGGINANCYGWQSVHSPHLGREVFRCIGFAPTCGVDPCAVKPPGSKAFIRVCSDYKLVSSPAYRKPVRRCKKYIPICGDGCLKSPAPKPEREGEPTEKEIKALATELARQAGEARGPAFAREILERGGIKSYRGRYLSEEYREIPLHLKRKSGLALDEMASEMGLDEAELVEQIRKAYPKGKKKKRRISWKLFEDDAYRMLRSGQLSAVAQELFPGMKREMVLHVQDVGKSEDPLVRCLERIGWKVSRVAQLQRSIQEKRQPDLFTGKTKPLNASEKELLENMDVCLRRAVAPKGIKPKGTPKQMSLLGTWPKNGPRFF